MDPGLMMEVGDSVIVIGGTHRGREATITGKTKKMYYIKFSSGQEVRVMMMSVARHTHNLPEADWQIKIIEELGLIRRNTEIIVDLLSRLSI
jgi:hypothetical protein